LAQVVAHGCDSTQRGRTRWIRRTAIGLAILVALGGILLASVTLEPMRAAVWQTLGQKCGTVGTGLQGRPLVDPATTTREEARFVRAYARCQAATLDDTVNFGDGTTTQTFVVEPAVGPLVGCGVADALTTNIVGGSGPFRRTERCAGLVQRPDGLHILGCGTLGDIDITSP
jgi:hypothetical protein